LHRDTGVRPVTAAAQASLAGEDRTVSCLDEPVQPKTFASAITVRQTQMRGLTALERAVPPMRELPEAVEGVRGN
jgi:hypothetical protein